MQGLSLQFETKFTSRFLPLCPTLPPLLFSLNARAATDRIRHYQRLVFSRGSPLQHVFHVRKNEIGLKIYKCINSTLT
jgi:hypothetical protein